MSLKHLITNSGAPRDPRDYARLGRSLETLINLSVLSNMAAPRAAIYCFCIQNVKYLEENTRIYKVGIVKCKKFGCSYCFKNFGKIDGGLGWIYSQNKWIITPYGTFASQITGLRVM